LEEEEAMSISDKELAEMDRQEEARMYPLSPWDGPTPYYLDCPLDAIEGVARGLAEGHIVFLLQRHIIQVGEREWSIDGDLPLWREARVYADDFREHGFLTMSRSDGVVEYSRRLTK